MKNFIISLIGLFCFSLFSQNAMAQKIAVTKGKLDFLKGETTLKIEFNYDKCKVGSKSEADYTDETVKKKNKEKPGSGDKWIKAWEEAKNDMYAPKFEVLFNENMTKKGIVANRTENEAKYTMIVYVTRLEPGYNIGVSRKNAEIDVEIVFVETANPDNILAKITELKSPGATWGGNDYEVGVRVSEAFAKCAKSLGIFLTKKIPK